MEQMKRITVILDADVLAAAMRLSGAPTYSATVRRALESFVRTMRARGILDLRGSGAWKGDLAMMRGDSSR